MSISGIQISGSTYIPPQSSVAREQASVQPHADEVGRSGGAFAGQQVRLAQAAPSQQLKELQQNTQNRLDALPKPGFTSKALTLLTAIIAAPIKLVVGIVGTSVSLLAGAVIRGGEKVFGTTEGAEARRAEMLATLGQPIGQSSILFKPSATDGKNIGDIMNEFRESHLGGDKRLTQQEMVSYIAAGERIVKALNQAHSGNPPLTVPAPDVRSGEIIGFELKPGIDSARAISWYLQAKAVADNMDTGKNTLLFEGAMIAKDPDNKLFNFLNSSENCYGRVSSHMMERSSSVETGFFATAKGLFKGGVSSLFGVGFSGQPLQRGIEDFGDKMPSRGGTLLFDKMHSSRPGGAPEIYLKWEPVGMPTTFNFRVSHDNDSVGNSFINRGVAFNRCIKHTINFAANGDPDQYRGEKMEKGDAKLVLNAFKETINGLGSVPKDVRALIIKSVEKFGAAEMESVLSRLAVTPEITNNQASLDSIHAVQIQLGAFMASMGSDLGIARKGGEVHASLS
jgi:hypothetical protein